MNNAKYVMRSVIDSDSYDLGVEYMPPKVAVIWVLVTVAFSILMMFLINNYWALENEKLQQLLYSSENRITELEQENAVIESQNERLKLENMQLNCELQYAK